eukprot:241941-Pyramimonas_sp.AAC.1
MIGWAIGPVVAKRGGRRPTLAASLPRTTARLRGRGSSTKDPHQPALVLSQTLVETLVRDV